MSDRIKWCIEAADQQVNRISSSSDARAMCVAVLASNALISEAIDRLSDAIRPPVVPLAKAPRAGRLEPIVSAGEVTGWQHIDEREMKNARIKELGEALMVSKEKIADLERIKKIRDARINELGEALVDRNGKISGLESVRVARDAHILDLVRALSEEREFSKRVQDRTKIVALERDAANSELASTKKRLADLEVSHAHEGDERRHANAELAHAKEFIARVEQWSSCGLDSSVALRRHLNEYLVGSRVREFARNGPDADAEAKS